MREGGGGGDARRRSAGGSGAAVVTSATKIRLALAIALILALEAACRSGLIAPTTLIPPTAMALSLLHILRDGSYDRDIAVTLGDVLAAAVLAIAGGFAAGVVLHAVPRLRRLLDPLLGCWYAIPTFVFYPLFIVLFGVGSPSIVAIAFALAVVAMIANTLVGLDRMPPVFARTARVWRLGGIATALLIRMPAAAPYLFTGAKLAVAYAFIGVIASEFILSGTGIGFAIAYAYNNFDNTTMYGLMLLVMLVVVAVNAVLQSVDRRMQARLAR